MTGTIKVSTAKLASTANSFNSTGNQIKNITSQMTSLVNAFSGSVWSGDAANAYKRKFSELQDDINRMISMINEHVTDLNAMAREYEKAESTNISTSQALSGDVII